MDDSVARPHHPRRLFALSLTPTTTTYADTPTHPPTSHPHLVLVLTLTIIPHPRDDVVHASRGGADVLYLVLVAMRRPAGLGLFLPSSPPPFQTSRLPDSRVSSPTLLLEARIPNQLSRAIRYDRMPRCLVV